MAVLALPFLTAKMVQAQNPVLDFALSNRTGFAVTNVYIAPDNADDIGEDVLGQDILATGDKVDIVFNPKATAKSWSMAIADKDGNVFGFAGFKLAEIEVITLYYK